MKPTALLLACLALPALAQTPTDTPASVRAELAQIDVLQKRATEVLDRERARSKAHLCEGKDAGDGSDPAVGNCWLREFKTTDADYLTYIRAIGALLRNPYISHRAAGAPQHLDFDTAEATWHTYRDQTCTAIDAQWAGGTLGRTQVPKCRLTVTWDHMNELASLYASF